MKLVNNLVYYYININETLKYYTNNIKYGSKFKMFQTNKRST